MPNIENNNSALKNQILNSKKINSPRFIPFNAFSDKFGEVLQQIRYPILSKSERSLLFMLNGYAYKDGNCYPRQSTLASRMSLTRVQISNLIRSLEKKGFLEVNRPSMVERHCDSKTNRYHFIWHKIYDKYCTLKDKILHEILPQIDVCTFNRINNEKSLAGNFFRDEKQNKKDLKEFCRQIDSRCQNLSRFNASAFTGQYLKKYPPQAVKETLQAVLNKMDTCVTDEVFKSFEWWGYASKIAKQIGGTLNEQQSILESNKHKIANTHIGFKGLLSGIG